MSIFLNEIEAKYREVTVMATWVDENELIDTVVLNGHCAEELVPESRNRGKAMQFAWALRWMFAKCQRDDSGVYKDFLSEVD